MNLYPDFVDLAPILGELSGTKPLSPSSRGFHSTLPEPNEYLINVG